MSEKAEQKPAPAPAPADDKAAAHAKGGGGGLMSKTPVLLGGVMLIEAVVLFAGFKFLGGGAPRSADAAEHVEHGEDAHGEEGHDAHEEHDGHGEAKEGKPSGPKRKSVELSVLEFRATNKVTGRTLLFDVSLYARVKGENEEQARSRIKDNEALIKDRVGTIIRQSDPEKLGGGLEPGLETLRRQVKHQLDEIIGEGIIDEILIPRCIPSRSEL